MLRQVADLMQRDDRLPAAGFAGERPNVGTGKGGGVGVALSLKSAKALFFFAIEGRAFMVTS
jgi:hypothetical protein